MTTSDYSTDPADLVPKCPACRVNRDVQPIDDPNRPWICTARIHGLQGLAFPTPTPGDSFRSDRDAAVAFAEREHPSDEWEPGAPR